MSDTERLKHCAGDIIDHLRAENTALRERADNFRREFDLLVAKLSVIDRHLEEDIGCDDAHRLLRDLLRRLDENQ